MNEPITAAVFEVFEDSADEWRWRLVATNGATIADSGQGYSRKEDAVRATNTVRARAATAAVEFPGAGGGGGLSVNRLFLPLSQIQRGEEHRFQTHPRGAKVSAWTGHTSTGPEVGGAEREWFL